MARLSVAFLLLALIVISGTEAQKSAKKSSSKDMMRKSIVYDKATPGVFYCPQHKPTGMDKMIVSARPLEKLCELNGARKPADYKSDCYGDVDESEFACKEKKRIMMRLNPPGSENAIRQK
ncbi:uncharacterized protein LOC132192729 isoform X2 [Neocloeon triangulifer]|uniref:uncharacterized protein LOC132192729 isoform X2 n=1 Tax=Neocloeon triangulifer TaxID=2078957 RepID=UPI00286EF7D8|nr:uncharacterized protein LOC132192729 isoform X2 [Neocloeon triangulifer]